MLLRRNTKAFKTILEIVASCQERNDRQNLIRVYITKIGQTINERIPVEGTQGEAVFFYDLNYQAILNNLKSSTHQVHQSDEVPGLYFFRSSLNWDENPFEFDPAVTKTFASLPELPATREKGKSKEFVLPPPVPTQDRRQLKKEVTKSEKTPPKKAVMFIDRGPKQPDYRLEHHITFSDLDKVTIWKGQLSKRDVLDYYNKVSDYILPYLENRALIIRPSSDDSKARPFSGFDELKAIADPPEWIKSEKLPGRERMLLCNDREHLLYYIEAGGVGFDPSLALSKSSKNPDHCVITLNADGDFQRVVDVALAAREILDGLHLPSFVKTDGASGLHIHLPLDSKSPFAVAREIAEFLCKLIRLKVPAIVAIESDGPPDMVALHFNLNLGDAGVVAPYSFGTGSSIVATPLQWDELNKDLRPEAFNHQTIFGRLKEIDDPFAALHDRKTNASSLLARLKENYGFLV